VGKSLLFQRLTGAYATVSNYPGTTVEITRGRLRVSGRLYELLDTPGMRSLLTLSEEEDVTKRTLLHERVTLLVHVVDAKDLERSLPLTLQLLEFGTPLILVLNMIDEARDRGLNIDKRYLEKQLGIPVAFTDAASQQGLTELREMIALALKKQTQSPCPFPYAPLVESELQRIESHLHDQYGVSKRSIALLMIMEDPAVHTLVQAQEGADGSEHTKSAMSTLLPVSAESSIVNPALTLLGDRQKLARQLAAHALGRYAQSKPRSLRASLDQITLSPVTGVPLLLAVLYGLYQFVGVFGAQTAVAFLENNLFGQYLNPWVTQMVQAVLPWAVAQDLFIGDYGIITLGLRYSIALILPIVTTFFLAFALIEDSGYLPRLALLIDRLFKGIGLSGRAVIPIVLGFGCDTMATLVTRTLETRREKLIATLLLALAIPCSAQLGVILAILANPVALWVWAAVILGNFVLIGFLAARLLPGERPLFHMEVPPLRLPRLSNVVVKTVTRVHWYLKEILPFFLGASVLIWLGQLLGVFQTIVQSLEPLVGGIGLPAQTATAFLFGFFRRDYGAAGLYDLHQSGVLDGLALVVAAVTLTLFVPCIAQFAITAKERGWKIAVAMAAFIFPYAFFVGWIVYLGLTQLGVAL
jgi:ferrous iron transport protein B